MKMQVDMDRSHDNSDRIRKRHPLICAYRQRVQVDKRIVQTIKYRNKNKKTHGNRPRYVMKKGCTNGELLVADGNAAPKEFDSK